MLPAYHCKVHLDILLHIKDALPRLGRFTTLHRLQRPVAE